MPDAIFVDPSAATDSVIRIAGNCYVRVGDSSNPPDTFAGDIEAAFGTCASCRPLYPLEPCPDNSDDAFKTFTNLYADIGNVVAIDGQCWTVGDEVEDDDTGVAVSVTNRYDTCTSCAVSCADLPGTCTDLNVSYTLTQAGVQYVYNATWTWTGSSWARSGGLVATDFTPTWVNLGSGDFGNGHNIPISISCDSTGWIASSGFGEQPTVKATGSTPGGSYPDRVYNADNKITGFSAGCS